VHFVTDKSLFFISCYVCFVLFCLVFYCAGIFFATNFAIRYEVVLKLGSLIGAEISNGNCEIDKYWKLGEVVRSMKCDGLVSWPSVTGYV